MTEKLQKYIADCGLMSRRAAEKCIAAGEFTVGGVTATLGDRVDPEKDVICRFGKPIGRITHKTTVVLYKPVGYVTTMNDELGRKSVAELIASAGPRLYPAGRLDRDSEGLLICTNDGELANRLMHPSHHLDKVYFVTVAEKVENGQIDTLRAMRVLDSEPIAAVGAEILNRGEGGSLLRMVLKQGKNRQIRRMCESVGLTVKSLKRVSVGPISLGGLEPGHYRALTPDEAKALERIQ